MNVGELGGKLPLTLRHVSDPTSPHYQEHVSPLPSSQRTESLGRLDWLGFAGRFGIQRQPLGTDDFSVNNQK